MNCTIDALSFCSRSEAQLQKDAEILRRFGNPEEKIQAFIALERRLWSGFEDPLDIYWPADSPDPKVREARASIIAQENLSKELQGMEENDEDVWFPVLGPCGPWGQYGPPPDIDWEDIDRRLQVLVFYAQPLHAYPYHHPPPFNHYC